MQDRVEGLMIVNIAYVKISLIDMNVVYPTDHGYSSRDGLSKVYYRQAYYGSSFKIALV